MLCTGVSKCCIRQDRSEIYPGAMNGINTKGKSFRDSTPARNKNGDHLTRRERIKEFEGRPFYCIEATATATASQKIYKEDKKSVVCKNVSRFSNAIRDIVENVIFQIPHDYVKIKASPMSKTECMNQPVQKIQQCIENLYADLKIVNSVFNTNHPNSPFIQELIDKQPLINQQLRDLSILERGIIQEAFKILKENCNIKDTGTIPQTIKGVDKLISVIENHQLKGDLSVEIGSNRNTFSFKFSVAKEYAVNHSSKSTIISPQQNITFDM